MYDIYKKYAFLFLRKKAREKETDLTTPPPPPLPQTSICLNLIRTSSRPHTKIDGQAKI